MRSRVQKIFSVVGLAAVMPSLGILPLLLMADAFELGGTGSILALALLRDIRGLVLPDPSPDVDHLPFYALAPKPVWLAVIIIVFAIPALALHYLWRGNARRAA